MAQASRFSRNPGEQLKGVYSANEYLTRVNLMSAYRGQEADTPVLHGEAVVVVGGGNTAMDAVRTARRLGATPRCWSTADRRRKCQPSGGSPPRPGRRVRIELLTNPVEILGDEAGWVRKVRCQRMKLGEPDASRPAASGAHPRQ